MIMGGGVDITVHLRTIETQLSGQKTTIALLNQRYARNFHYWQQIRLSLFGKILFIIIFSIFLCVFYQLAFSFTNLFAILVCK